MDYLHNLRIKLFLNLCDKEIAEVLENIEGLQHIETFRELKEDIINKYELSKADKELDSLRVDLID